MASFTPSNLVDAQTKLKAEFTKPEMREKVLPTLRLGISNEGILISGAQELRKREDRPVHGYYKKRQSRTPGSTRTATHTGSRGDSNTVLFTWVTYADTFSISLKEMDTNVFSFEEALQQGMLNCILNIHSQVETDTVNNLLTNVTQVVKSTAINIGNNRAVWNAGNYAYEIQDADRKQFYQISKEVMVNNYYGDASFDAVASSGNFIDATFWQSQGQGNQTNTQFQFGGVNINRSIELSNSNYPGGVSLLMQNGTFGLIQWIPKQNRDGHGDYNSYLGGYGSFDDPTGTGLQFAMHGYALRNDTSSLNGVQQDDEMQFEISVDVAFALGPLSNALETPIIQMAQTN